MRISQSPQNHSSKRRIPVQKRLRLYVLVEGPSAPCWSDREHVLLAAVDEVARPARFRHDAWLDLRRHLDEPAALELMLVGHYEMLATTINTLRGPARPAAEPAGFGVEVRTVSAGEIPAESGFAAGIEASMPPLPRGRHESGPGARSSVHSGCDSLSPWPRRASVVVTPIRHIRKYQNDGLVLSRLVIQLIHYNR